MTFLKPKLPLSTPAATRVFEENGGDDNPGASVDVQTKNTPNLLAMVSNLITSDGIQVLRLLDIHIWGIHFDLVSGKTVVPREALRPRGIITVFYVFAVSCRKQRDDRRGFDSYC